MSLDIIPPFLLELEPPDRLIEELIKDVNT